MAAIAILPNTMRMLVTALDASQAIESIHRWYQNRQSGQRNNDLDVASVANRLVLLGFTISETALLLNGAEADTLALLKKIEFILRATDTGMQVMIWDEESRQTNEQSSLSRIAKLEKRLLGPLAALGRSALEMQGYQEQAYLEAYRKDPTATRRDAVYHVSTPLLTEEMQVDPETRPQHLLNVHIDTIERPIDPQESAMRLQNSMSAAYPTTYFQAAAQMGVFSSVFDAATPLYEQLARFLEAQLPQTQPGTPTFFQGPEAFSEDFDLLRVSRIPPFLSDDVVFSRYICPITREPIRDPVQDSNGHTLYERTSIHTWLQIHQISPVTRNPMDIQDLKEMPAVKALIDARLQFHQEKLNEFLQQQQNAPISDLDLDHQAGQEHTP